jgi:DNA polymerase
VGRKQQLEKLHQEIRNCKKCPLWKTRRNVSPGEGRADAQLMFIAEAPGRMEDLKGRPFVGPSGRYLDKLFDLAKINREDVFITAPVKCRPVIDNRNRKPKKEEIEACLPYLKKQIEIIDPKYFILLGEVAFSVFFPKEKLKNFRGKWIEKDGKLYFPTYHPAAGLRFPKIRKILEKDFEKIKKSSFNEL